jgi:BMFP domain-containing protein YqiC
MKAGEVDELKHRIEELESLLTKRPPKKKKRAKEHAKAGKSRRKS